MTPTVSKSLARFAPLVALVALWVGAGSAQAAEPDGRSPTLSWWSVPFDFDDTDLLSDSFDFDGYTETWWTDKWGIRGSRYETTLSDFGDEATGHTSVDVKRRFFSLTDSSFVALGAGWESIDLDDGATSTGLRFMAEGRLGIGDTLSLYGQTSWLPELDDVGGRSNLTGQGIEAGLTFDPAPSMSVRLGYRRFRLDYDEAGGTGTSESNGFILGAGFHW